jgi:hypothetical protein
MNVIGVRWRIETLSPLYANCTCNRTRNRTKNRTHVDGPFTLATLLHCGVSQSEGVSLEVSLIMN